MRAFFDLPVPFRWWVIVGNGGSGKSRFALEVTDRLPDGWAGGFIAKENLTLRDAAAWRPTANTLWIVDDAALHQAVLRQIIAVWEQLFRDSKFKVRMVLLERGFSRTSGWGGELSAGISWETAAINQTLYHAPLVLEPLAALAREFLSKVCEHLSITAAERLRAELAKVDDKQLMEKSRFGNPLLLQLIAAHLLSVDADAFSALTTDGGSIVEKHLERELDILKSRCEEAGIRFSAMLDLLFATTSLFPIPILFDSDTLALVHERQVLMVKDAEGRYRPTTVSEARATGVDIEKLNEPVLSILSTITGIDDIDAYLAVLEEAGLARATHYSIQPDLVGDALLRLVLSTRGVLDSLKRRRGEFNRARVRRLVTGCAAMSNQTSHRAHGAWGRLDDRVILAIVDYLRLAGNSIRWALLNLREINRVRTAKVPFDAKFVFAPNKIHRNAPLVGRYWTEVRNAIDMEPIDEDTASRLALSEHAWLLPYVIWLVDLTLGQEAQLGLIICEVENRSILSRLTNLSNFLQAVTYTLSRAFSREREGEGLSDPERNAVRRLTDAALAFALLKAHPTITSVGDETFTDVYLMLARMLIECSYGVANQLLGRTATPLSRQRAVEGLEIARLALRVAPRDPETTYVDRNLALLKIADLSDASEIARIYLSTLGIMREYGSAKAFSETIADLFTVASARGGTELLSIVLPALVKAPQHLIDGDLITGPILRSVFVIMGEDQAYERIEVVIGTLCQLVASAFRAAESKDSAENFVTLVKLAIFATNRSTQEVSLREKLFEMFRQARDLMDDGKCSQVFIDAILEAAAAYFAVGDYLDNRAGFASAMPFEVAVSEIDPDIWDQIELKQSEKEFAAHVESIRLGLATYHSPDGRSYCHPHFVFAIENTALAKDRVTATKAYPSASGDAKCCSHEGGSAVEQITNTVAFGSHDDRLSAFLARVSTALWRRGGMCAIPCCGALA